LTRRGVGGASEDGGASEGLEWEERWEWKWSMKKKHEMMEGVEKHDG